MAQQQLLLLLLLLTILAAATLLPNDIAGSFNRTRQVTPVCTPIYSNAWFLGSYRPNRLTIGSSVFAQYARVTIAQYSDGHTDHGTCDMRSNRLHL